MDGSELAVIARFITWLFRGDYLTEPIEQNPAAIGCLIVLTVAVLLTIMYLTSSM